MHHKVLKENKNYKQVGAETKLSHEAWRGGDVNISCIVKQEINLLRFILPRIETFEAKSHQEKSNQDEMSRAGLCFLLFSC